jgi:hypothetical protein
MVNNNAKSRLRFRAIFLWGVYAHCFSAAAAFCIEHRSCAAAAQSARRAVQGNHTALFTYRNSQDRHGGWKGCGARLLLQPAKECTGETRNK